MRQHEVHSPRDAPQPIPSWCLLLLVLLVLLPVTVSMASPEPLHAVDGSPAESGFHSHGPSDTPICHHVSNHQTVPGLVADKRDLDVPASDEGSAALPAHDPASNLIPTYTFEIPQRLSARTLPGVPTYLLTQRLRV